MEKIISLKREVQLAAPGLDSVLLPWDDESLAKAAASADLIVNASPLGMKPGEPSVLPSTLLRSSHLVYDMVYRGSGETPLIAAAKTAGGFEQIACHVI